MSSIRGPRRTRVYDANYNIGQSYYKSALDNLDRKYNGNSKIDSILETSPVRPIINIENGFDDDLQTSRARASRAIREESVLDARLGRNSAMEDAIDEDIQESLNRMRASKSKTRALINDLEVEDAINTANRRANLHLGEKLLDLAGEDELGDTIRSRALKMVSRATNGVDSIQHAAFKRTALDTETLNSGASMRAQQSKARLADIESELFDRSEKLLQREKRAANLKKILIDNDIETTRIGKHVTF